MHKKKVTPAKKARMKHIEEEFVSKVKHAFSQIGVDVKKIFGRF